MFRPCSGRNGSPDPGALRMSALTVGQELWFVPRERYLGQPRMVKVTKVGRKWAVRSSANTVRDEASRFGVSKSTINRVRLGKLYPR